MAYLKISSGGGGGSEMLLCTFFIAFAQAGAWGRAPSRQRHRESGGVASRSWRFRLIFWEKLFFRHFFTFFYVLATRVAWLRREKEFHCPKSATSCAKDAVCAYCWDRTKSWGCGAESPPLKNFWFFCVKSSIFMPVFFSCFKERRSSPAPRPPLDTPLCLL